MSARIVVVHDRMEPPVVAGRYEVRVEQTIGGAATLGTVPADVRHVRVTGPRYRLAPNEILSTFPPANADGPFVTRLAQIALKRRTLPWERADGPTRPWLALVLLSDGEGTYLPSVPVNEAVTSGVALGGDNDDGPTCAAIEVTQRVVDQVFPSRQDLPFTCHVRQVPLDDTELAQGDDDGWIAVVIGTRLPRPGVRYRACLVSLEGQWDELPDNPPVEDRVRKVHVYDTLSSETVLNARRPRADGVTLSVADTLSESSFTGGPVRGRAAPAAGLDREVVDHAVPAAGVGHTVADAWGSVATPETSSSSPFAGQTGYVTVGTGSVILDVDLHIIEPAARLLRFPVLASWEFRCEGDKDFAALVQGLDVGLLGTIKPPASPAAAVPETSDTGHVVLDGNERDGDAVRSWYRGPFVPRAVDRRAPRAVHVADQLRRVAEDGRIELGEAAAFELGRLLALSSPSTVAALREWRRLGFSRRRTARIGRGSVLGGILEHWDVKLQADALAHGMLTVLGVPEIADTRLPAGPLIDPLPELALFADVAGTVAGGLALPLEDVRSSFEGTAMPKLTLERIAPVAEVGFEAFREDATLVEPMQRELAGTVERFGAFLEGGPLGDAGPGVQDLFEGGTS